MTTRSPCLTTQNNSVQSQHTKTVVTTPAAAPSPRQQGSLHFGTAHRLVTVVYGCKGVEHLWEWELWVLTGNLGVIETNCIKHPNINIIFLFCHTETFLQNNTINITFQQVYIILSVLSLNNKNPRTHPCKYSANCSSKCFTVDVEKNILQEAKEQHHDKLTLAYISHLTYQLTIYCMD